MSDNAHKGVCPAGQAMRGLLGKRSGVSHATHAALSDGNNNGRTKYRMMYLTSALNRT
jgi:hypothetical protein